IWPLAMVIAFHAIIPKGAAVPRFGAAPAGPGVVPAITVNMAPSAGEVLPPKAAVMADWPRTWPVATPAPRPEGESVATAAPPGGTLTAVHVVRGFAVTSLDNPSLNIASAVYCWVPVTGIEAVAGVTMIDTTVALLTVKVVELDLPPKVAVMVDWPMTLPVATPDGKIVATPTAGATSVAVQVEDAVTSLDDPSLYVPVAVYC